MTKLLKYWDAQLKEYRYQLAEFRVPLGVEKIPLYDTASSDNMLDYLIENRVTIHDCQYLNSEDQ